MITNTNNAWSLILLLLLLGAVLFAGSIYKQPVNEVAKEATNSIEPKPDILSQDSKDRELEFIQNELKTLEPKRAYEAFKERNFERDVYAQHEYAHIFGKELYKTVGIPGVAICDSAFAFGCYHSFFGHALMENGLDIIFDLEKACIEAYGVKGLGCQHGIGHGVLAEVGSEQLQAALDACIQLEWKGPVGGCTSGVFMEYNFNTMNNADARHIDPENPYYPCSELATTFQEGCYYELPSWWVATYHGGKQLQDPTITAAYQYASDYCTEVAGEVNKIGCFRGLGNTIAGTLSYSIPEIKNYCSLSSNPIGRTHCLEGAAWFLSWEPKYSDTWEGLCSDLENRPKEICLNSKSMI